jgi:hypothetical protein
MAHPTSGSGAPPGSAMQRAVAAEADARHAIGQAEAEAAAALAAARARARAILDAVPRRVARLRQRGANAVRKAIAAIQAEEAAALQSLGKTALPPELMEPATEALAARLTGGEPR